MDFKAKFIEALETNNRELMRRIPKTELHTHTGLNGNREFLYKKAGKWINPINTTLSSLDEMHRWVSENMGDMFSGIEGEKTLVEACFEQTKYDSIAVINIGEDVWAHNAIFNGNMERLISIWQNANETFSPETKLIFQVGLSRHVPVKLLEEWAAPFFEEDCFASIDLYGDELAQPIESFVPLYRKAKEKGYILRAHVGEWGTADDVVKAAELLELDEVQHGIAAATSQAAMNFLADNKIRLNVCPTSNIRLGRVQSMKMHPIRTLFDNGISVTVNSDDLLVFGSTVSDEFFELYNCGLFSALELNTIRERSFDTI